MGLFSMPLCKLYKKAGDKDYKYLSMRACVIGIIAHLTTVIALMAMFFGADITFCICCDMVISCLSLMGMYSWNSWMFDWIVPGMRQYKREKAEAERQKDIELAETRKRIEMEEKRQGITAETKREGRQKTRQLTLEKARAKRKFLESLERITEFKH